MNEKHRNVATTLGIMFGLLAFLSPFWHINTISVTPITKLMFLLYILNSLQVFIWRKNLGSENFHREYYGTDLERGSYPGEWFAMGMLILFLVLAPGLTLVYLYDKVVIPIYSVLRRNPTH